MPARLGRGALLIQTGNWHRNRAITLAVQMRSGEQIFQFGEAVDKALATVRPQLPPDLIIARTSDQPKQVRELVSLLMTSLYEAIVLVVVVALVGPGTGGRRCSWLRPFL